MLLDRHLGFMHIARVAQGCQLDNQAEFVQSHHESINPSKKFIGTRISRLVLCQIDYSSNCRDREPPTVVFELMFCIDPSGFVYNHARSGVFGGSSGVPSKMCS